MTAPADLRNLSNTALADRISQVRQKRDEAQRAVDDAQVDLNILVLEQRKRENAAERAAASGTYRDLCDCTSTPHYEGENGCQAD